MDNADKSKNVQELIELLKTDPQAAFEKMGIPPISPERLAELKTEYAGLTWEEIRDRHAAKIAAAKAALGKVK